MKLRKLSHSDFILLEVSYCYGTETDHTFDVLIVEKHTAVYQDVDVTNMALKKKKVI